MSRGRLVRPAARALIAGVAVTALAFGLSACRDGGLDSAPAKAPPSASLTQSPGGPGGPGGAVSGAPDVGLTSTPAGGATSAPSAALAAVSADLSDVNAGASQADTDLGAGDSDRAKPDDPG